MESAEKGLQHSLAMPYLTGVYLAVNAIPNAWLVVDGPNCIFFRTAQIQGNHDWHANLCSADGLHRVADTDCTTQRAAQGDPQLLIQRLLQVNAIEDCKLILLTAMSPPAVTGRQYDKVLRELEGRLQKPVVQIRTGSLKGDWLHGYAWALEDLAGQIELKPDLHDDHVGLVGYLFDRNEADHEANLCELTRLLEGLSLKVSACWLDGSPAESLSGIARAKTILSFPYGRQAAQKLAERTGAQVVDCRLPFGLEGTSQWLRQTGKATGREKQAEEMIDQELSRVAPKLEWILPHALVNKNVAFCGSDPYLYQELEQALEELGLRVSFKAYVAHQDHLEGIEQKPDQLLMLNPESDQLAGPMGELAHKAYLDLAFTNSRLLQIMTYSPLRIPLLELGFPSYFTHALLDCPFLGYRGVLKLVERMANALSQVSTRAPLT